MIFHATHNFHNLIQKGLTLVLGAFLASGILLPSTASAETVSELQAEIDQLLREINDMTADFNEAGLETPPNLVSSNNSVCPFTWSRNLTLDVEGNDVLKLQQFLNASTDTRVALDGAGSPGSETAYYGFRTAEAVSKFQVKYRSEILTPNDLTEPTAFFGPSTRTKINSLCTTASVPTAITPPKSSTVSPKSTASLTGSASLEDFNVSKGGDTKLEEGQNKVHIMDAEFTVEDGDILLNRIEVVFEHVKGREDDPWDIFSEVYLLADGKNIAQKDADDEDEWSDDSPYDGAHTLRFSGLDIRIDEDETFEFAVMVGVQDDVRGVDDGLSWEVFVPDRGVRALDADKVPNYIGDENDDVSIDIVE